jgi:6-phosphogluconate dehydrogenase (decarboxylating)
MAYNGTGRPEHVSTDSGPKVTVNTSYDLDINAPIYGVNDLHREMSRAFAEHDRELVSMVRQGVR